MSALGSGGEVSESRSPVMRRPCSGVHNDGESSGDGEMTEHVDPLAGSSSPRIGQSGFTRRPTVAPRQYSTPAAPGIKMAPD
jgi:hypothetical protein